MPAWSLWSWVSPLVQQCGFTRGTEESAQWVKANPELFPKEVPGMSDELLRQVDGRGGSPDQKIQIVRESFKVAAKHLESLQRVFRRRALDKRHAEGLEGWPLDVEEVIMSGTYADCFLESYDGQSFVLHREEIAPCHFYTLGLEVSTGGAYWSNVSVNDAGLKHSVETVSASSYVEGSSSIVAHYGAGQRGAVFVWRWQHDLSLGPYKIPDWLARTFALEGSDPVRKLTSEQENVRRWEAALRQRTAQFCKADDNKVEDEYAKEVLKLWPCEFDGATEMLKKCAWIEGLEAALFADKQHVVAEEHYDSEHSMILFATITKRTKEAPLPGSRSPPWRLTTAWEWAPTARGPRRGASAAVSPLPESDDAEEDRLTEEESENKAQSDARTESSSSESEEESSSEAEDQGDGPSAASEQPPEPQRVPDPQKPPEPPKPPDAGRTAETHTTPQAQKPLKHPRSPLLPTKDLRRGK